MTTSPPYGSSGQQPGAVPGQPVPPYGATPGVPTNQPAYGAGTPAYAAGETEYSDQAPTIQVPIGQMSAGQVPPAAPGQVPPGQYPSDPYQSGQYSSGQYSSGQYSSGQYSSGQVPNGFAPGQAPMGQVPMGQVPAPGMAPAYATPPPARKSGSNGPVIAVIAVVMVAVIGVLAFFLIQGKDTKPVADPTTSPSQETTSGSNQVTPTPDTKSPTPPPGGHGPATSLSSASKGDCVSGLVEGTKLSDVKVTDCSSSSATHKILDKVSSETACLTVAGAEAAVPANPVVAVQYLCMGPKDVDPSQGVNIAKVGDCLIDDSSPNLINKVKKTECTTTGSYPIQVVIKEGANTIDRDNAYDKCTAAGASNPYTFYPWSMTRYGDGSTLPNDIVFCLGSPN